MKYLCVVTVMPQCIETSLVYSCIDWVHLFVEHLQENILLLFGLGQPLIFFFFHGYSTSLCYHFPSEAVFRVRCQEFRKGRKVRKFVNSLREIEGSHLCFPDLLNSQFSSRNFIILYVIFLLLPSLLYLSFCPTLFNSFLSFILSPSLPPYFPLPFLSSFFFLSFLPSTQSMILHFCSLLVFLFG